MKPDRISVRSRDIVRTSHLATHQRRRNIPCPLCGWHRLIDAGNRTNTVTFPPSHPCFEDADYFQKCCKCKNIIGISKSY